MNAIKAKAEENKRALSDEINRRFQDFSPAGFDEAKAKAQTRRQALFVKQSQIDSSQKALTLKVLKALTNVLKPSNEITRQN